MVLLKISFVNVSPEKTPFLTFSRASVTTSLVLTDFAISILSNKIYTCCT